MARNHQLRDLAGELIYPAGQLRTILGFGGWPILEVLPLQQCQQAAGLQPRLPSVSAALQRAFCTQVTAALSALAVLTWRHSLHLRFALLGPLGLCLLGSSAARRARLPEACWAVSPGSQAAVDARAMPSTWRPIARQGNRSS